MGPTASGKTALASELIRHYPFEIISIDSAMIYRDMDIGTAKPSAQELVLAPHHLIDIVDPTESYSAARCCSDVFALCEAILQQGNIPLLVGGTMMYFNALQKGLSVLPEANEVIRKQLEREGEQLGWDTLHLRLANIDPQAALRIHAHDAQRIQRALEVFYISGRSMTELLAQGTPKPDYHFINFSLMPEDRQWLHSRIATRFQEMLAMGFVEEVQQLQSKWQVNLNCSSMRCVGYRQIIDYLQGDYDIKTMEEKGIAATRQLAKRQLTWLRHWNDAWVYNPQNPAFIHEIIAKIEKLLDNVEFRQP
jgi:tRNA dimethylallyltransferase